MDNNNFSFKNDILFSYQKYDIIQELLSQINYSQLLISCDENTYEYCYPKISPYLPKHQVIKIKSGEVHKNIKTCQNIWQQMTEYQLDRKALIINLGGGVLLDMLGFCAKTYKRGIHFLNIPTTLLAQVDASVGGKLGIDFLDYKNHIGLFANPEKVWIDVDFLETQSKRQFFSGFAEVIKHCLIYDRTQWRLLKDNLYKINLEKLSDEKDFWLKLIKHSVEIKAKVVSQDPQEQGLRKILNFGHTIGHALESFYLHSQVLLLHGEAVALGMVAEAYLSYQKKLISLSDLAEIRNCIFILYSKFRVQETDVEAISSLVLQDKKNENNQIQMTLLGEMGKGIYNQEMSLKEIQNALYYLVDKMKYNYSGM